MTTLVKTWLLCPQDSFKTELKFTEAVKLFLLSEVIWLVGAFAPAAVFLLIASMGEDAPLRASALPPLIYVLLQVATYYFSFVMQSNFLSERAFAPSLYPSCLLVNHGRPGLSRSMAIKSAQAAIILVAAWALSRVFLGEPAPGLQNVYGTNFIIGAVSAIVAAPVFEEILYRGVVYHLFRGVFSRRLGENTAHWLAVTVSALIFALQHASITAIPRLFLMGAIFSHLYRRSGTLLAPMIAHSLANAIVTIIIAF